MKNYCKRPTVIPNVQLFYFYLLSQKYDCYRNIKNVSTEYLPGIINNGIFPLLLLFLLDLGYPTEAVVGINEYM